MRLDLIVLAAIAFSPSLAAQDVEDGSERKTITVQFQHGGDKVNQAKFDNARGAPHFRATIGGQAVCALLDTGAEVSVVGLEVARKAGLAVSGPKGALTGVSGERRTSHLVEAVPIEIPGQLAFQRDMVGAELPEYVCADGSRLGFVLGMDFLGKMAVLLDNPRKRMILLPSGRINVKEDRFVRLPWTDGEVEGAIEGATARFEVDTGSSTPLSVRASQFVRYFPSEDIVSLPSSMMLRGRTANEGVADVEFSVGPLRITGNAKRVAYLNGSAPASIGYPVIGQTVVVLDASAGAIFLRKPDASDD